MKNVNILKSRFLTACQTKNPTRERNKVLSNYVLQTHPTKKIFKMAKMHENQHFCLFQPLATYSEKIHFSKICLHFPASWSVDQSSSLKKVISRYLVTFPNVGYIKMDGVSNALLIISLPFKQFYWTFLLHMAVFCYFYINIWW